MMILGGLVAGGSSKSLKKAYAREVNNIHSWFPPSKMSKYNESNIIFSKKDARGIRQPHDDPLVIMLDRKSTRLNSSH